MSRCSPFAIELCDAERFELERRSRCYTLAYSQVMRARIVLLAAAGVANVDIAEELGVHVDVVSRWRFNASAQALAGSFQVRAGDDVAAAISKPDKAATMDVGLPEYFRGLALAELLPGGGPPDAGPAAAEGERADQVIADLELVLSARDRFPVVLLRAAYQGLARAYLTLGRQRNAAEALRRSGLGPTATDRQPMFTGLSLTACDGMRLSAPGTLSPAPNVHVAQSYDFGDFAFIQTSAGVVAIDTGTSPDGVLAALADLGLKDDAPVSHLILTHAHFDHIDGTAAVPGPDTQVIVAAGFPAELDQQRHWSVPRSLTGIVAGPAPDAKPDRLISEQTSLLVGEAVRQLRRGGDATRGVPTAFPQPSGRTRRLPGGPHR